MRYLLMALILTSVSGCGIFATSPPPTDVGCLVFEKLRLSRQDKLTKGTDDQVVLHNKRWERLCKSG